MSGEPAERRRAGLRALGSQVLPYGVASLVPVLLALGSSAILTRLLPAGEFGRYALVASAAVFLASLSGQWLQQGITRYLPGHSDRSEGRDLLGAAAIGLWLVTALVLLLGGLLVSAAALSGGRAGLRLMLPIVAIAAGWSQFSILSAILQSSFLAGRFARFRIVEASARFVLGLLFVAVFRTAIALLWSQALSTALVLPLLWSAMRESSAREWRRLWPLVRRLAAYGLPMTGYFLAATILDVSDRYVIEFFRGSQEVGIYAASYGIVYGAVGLAAAPALLAAHPVLMNSWTLGDRQAASRWLGMIIEWFVVVGLVATATLWLLSQDLAEVLLGVPYRGGHSIMAPVVAGVVAWQAGMYTHKPLEFTEKTGILLIVSLSLAGANLIANILLVPTWGYIAAAYTTLGAYLAYAVVTGWLGRRVLPWKLDVKALGRWAAGVALVSVAAKGLEGLVQPQYGHIISLVVKLLAVAVMGAALLRKLAAQLDRSPPPVAASGVVI